jgi:hypothetical protein
MPSTSITSPALVATADPTLTPFTINATARTLATPTTAIDPVGDEMFATETTFDPDDSAIFYARRDRNRKKSKAKPVVFPALDRTVASVPLETLLLNETMETLQFIKDVFSACSLTNPGYTRENIDMTTIITIGSPVMVKV